MRLLFAIPQGLDDPSGRGRYWPLAKELVRLGHEVTLVCLHSDLAACLERRFTREGVRIVYAGQMMVRKHDGTKSYYPQWRLPLVATQGLLAMAQELRRHPADAVHIAKAQPVNGLATLALPGAWRHRRVYVDCDDHEAGSNNFQAGWQRRIVGAIEDGLVRAAAAISVNTTAGSDRLLGLGVPAQRIVLVPNGIDRARLRAISPELPHQLRREHGLEGRPLVVYVGSLSLANHAVDLLLRAFAHPAGPGPETRLALVGGGEDATTLRQLAGELGLSERVTFLGPVDSVAALAWLQAANLSVDPARDDEAHRARGPLKLVEAMAVGTPTLTSPVGDRWETLAQGAAGYFAPADDAAALAAEMRRALDDPAGRQGRSQVGLAAAEEYFWDRLVGRFLGLYTAGP